MKIGFSCNPMDAVGKDGHDGASQSFLDLWPWYQPLLFLVTGVVPSENTVI